MTPFRSCHELHFHLWPINGADVLASEVLSNTFRVHNLADDAVHFILRITFPFVIHNGITVKQSAIPYAIVQRRHSTPIEGKKLRRVVLDLRRDRFVQGRS